MLKNRTFTLFSVVNVTPGTRLSFSSSEIWVKSFWMMSKKATGNNTGSVYIGDSTVDKDTSQQMKLNPDDYWAPPIPLDTVINLATFFLDATTAGDGVVGGYIEETNL